MADALNKKRFVHEMADNINPKPEHLEAMIEAIIDIWSREIMYIIDSHDQLYGIRMSEALYFRLRQLMKLPEHDSYLPEGK